MQDLLPPEQVTLLARGDERCAARNMSFTKTEVPREIERKFLLQRLPDGLYEFPHEEIAQGYLAIEPGIQVRLRKKGSIRSLAFKRGSKSAREEREIRLSAEQFDALWPATEGRRLTKTRYDVPYKQWIIEVDIYRGRLDGLIVAEVEFEDEKSCRQFVPPNWLGDDVTGKSRYSNVLLAQE